MRSWTLALPFASLAILAACTAGTAEEDTAPSADQDLSSTAGLTCKLATARFDIAPGAGPILTGTLNVGTGSNVMFDCANPEAPAPGLLALCTQRQGTWKVVVTRGTSGVVATLKIGSGSDLPLACQANAAPDAGAPDAAPSTDASVTADSGEQSATVTFDDVLPLLNANCSGCHQNAFGTVAAVRSSKARMITLISAGRMPRGKPTWKDTAEGLLVLDYLRNSPELQ